jgi:hypothetical protein
MDDRIELINREIAWCKRKIILLQARAVGDQNSFTVEGKTINVEWKLNGGADGDSDGLNMISNIPEFRELVRKIEDNPITIEITSIGSTAVSFNVGNELSYIMFAPKVCTINGKKICFSWNGDFPRCSANKSKSDMIAEMPEFTQWLDSTLFITEPIEITVEKIEYYRDYISFIAFKTNDYEQYYFESNHFTVEGTIINIKNTAQPLTMRDGLLETMLEFKLWVKDFDSSTKTPIEISVDRLDRKDDGGISFVAFRTSDGKKYYLINAIHKNYIHSISTGRQIQENLDDLFGSCEIMVDFSEIPELNRICTNMLNFFKRKLIPTDFISVKTLWNDYLYAESMITAEKFSRIPELNKKVQTNIMEMIKVQMEASKTQLTTIRDDPLMGKYKIIVKYISSVPNLERLGGKISRDIQAACERMFTNSLSAQIIEYNKNVENIVQGYRSQLKGDQIKNNSKRHTQSGNACKQLKQTLDIMMGGENEDKTIIIQNQIKAIELMQIHLTEVMGNRSIRTNNPPPTKDLIAWLSDTQDL